MKNRNLYVLGMIFLFIMFINITVFSEINYDKSPITIKDGVDFLKGKPIAFIANKGQVDPRILFYV